MAYAGETVAENTQVKTGQNTRNENLTKHDRIVSHAQRETRINKRNIEVQRGMIDKATETGMKESYNNKWRKHSTRNNKGTETHHQKTTRKKIKKGIDSQTFLCQEKLHQRPRSRYITGQRRKKEEEEKLNPSA